METKKEETKTQGCLSIIILVASIGIGIYCLTLLF